MGENLKNHPEAENKTGKQGGRKFMLLLWSPTEATFISKTEVQKHNKTCQENTPLK